jgi:hypothetical protein
MTCAAFASTCPPPRSPRRASSLMIFDVDGVLTDGSLHYGAEAKPSSASTCRTASASS